MCEGGEGGIREVEKEYEGIDFSCILRGRRIWSIETELVTVGFTVHRG
jgi:hypothetical protein